MSKFISLSRSKNTIVDDEDYDSLMQKKWYCSSIGYASRTSSNPRKEMPMHRAIMNCPEGMVVDHINGNKLDNRKINLRICTHKENIRNGKGMSHKKYKGAYFSKERSKFYSKIKVNYKSIHLGYFSTEEAAASAYNQAAIKYHGEFAKLNVISKTIN